MLAIHCRRIRQTWLHRSPQEPETSQKATADLGDHLADTLPGMASLEYTKPLNHETNNIHQRPSGDIKRYIRQQKCPLGSYVKISVF